MAAASIATDEQLRSQAAPPRVSLREKIARHLDGEAPESNYAAMCAVLERDPSAGPLPCEDCDGLRYRLLTPAVLAAYAERVATREAELEELRKQLDRIAPDEFDGSEQRKAIEGKIYRTGENILELRKEQNKRGVCRTCKGSGVAPRRRGDVALRGDSLFTTTTCPACRGADARNERRHTEDDPNGEHRKGDRKYPTLLLRHRGSSTGELRIRGNREVDGSIVSDPRDDKAANRQDACPRCTGPERTGEPGYIVPISIRPTLKTSEVVEQPEGVEGLPEHFPASDFADPLEGSGEIAHLLERFRRADPLVAAGVIAYVGPEGDRYATHRWGRRLALWPLLEPARALAADFSPGAPPQGYDATLRVIMAARVAEVQGEDSTPERGAWIGEAEDEALLLEERVLRAIDEAEQA